MTVQRYTFTHTHTHTRTKSLGRWVSCRSIRVSTATSACSETCGWTDRGSRSERQNYLSQCSPQGRRDIPPRVHIHDTVVKLTHRLDSSWNVMAHGDAREGKWRGNWRMQWVASTLRTTSEHGVSSITTADAHTSAASSRLKWRPPADLNGLVHFARKTRFGFCACAITFQTQSTWYVPTYSVGRRTSSGIREWLLESYIVFAISFSNYRFIYSIIFGVKCLLVSS